MLKEKMNYMKDWLRKSKKMILVIFCVMIFLEIGIIYFLILYKPKASVLFCDGDVFKNEYESLNGEITEDGKEYPRVHLSGTDIVQYLDIDGVLDILENGYGVIYFGSADCMYCRSAVQVLMDTAKDTDLTDLYYFEVEKYWDELKLNQDGNVVRLREASSSYETLLEQLGDKYLYDYILMTEDGKKVNTLKKRVSIPLVLFVVRGDIISSNVGTLFSQNDPYSPLDEFQVEGLSEIYSSGIRDVLEGIKNG